MSEWRDKPVLLPERFNKFSLSIGFFVLHRHRLAYLSGNYGMVGKINVTTDLWIVLIDMLLTFISLSWTTRRLKTFPR